MKARILEVPAPVYDAADTLTPIATLPVGQEVEMGSIKNLGGKQFVAVVLPDGRHGYVAGDTKIYHLKLVTLMQPDATVYSDSNVESLVRTRYRRGDKFYLAGVVKLPDGKTWVKVRDDAGMEGFIEEQTKIKVIPLANKSVARQNMLRGALWCAGGTVVTAATWSAASSGSGGGTYFIAYGPMIFGAFQFLKGVYQYMTTTV